LLWSRTANIIWLEISIEIKGFDTSIQNLTDHRDIVCINIERTWMLTVECLIVIDLFSFTWSDALFDNYIGGFIWMSI
jgi:hypothetical protein